MPMHYGNPTESKLFIISINLFPEGKRINSLDHEITIYNISEHIFLDVEAPIPNKHSISLWEQPFPRRYKNTAHRSAIDTQSLKFVSLYFNCKFTLSTKASKHYLENLKYLINYSLVALLYESIKKCFDRLRVHHSFYNSTLFYKQHIKRRVLFRCYCMITILAIMINSICNYY